MPTLSSFEQALSYTGSKIAHMSEEFAKHHDKLPSKELKTMTDELKKSQQNLAESLKGNPPPDFDSSLLDSIMSYINKIKKSTTSATIETTTRKTQKMNFLEALSEFQTLLKNLKKHTKHSLKNHGTKIPKKAIVKIQSIKGKSLVQSRELDRHLSLTESKLSDLKKGFQKGQSFLSAAQYQDITTHLKKTHLYLTKTKALQKSLSGKAKPEYNKTTLKNLISHINFLQNKYNQDMLAGTALTQVNLFWSTLREFQTLVQELENLKKIRGKAVAHVESDLLS